MGTSMICDLAAAIIRDGKVPSDWEQIFIVCLYKGKGDALERGNYHGLKLTEQVVKVLERIVDGRGATIRQKAYCNILQYGKPVLQYILQYAVLYYPNLHVTYLAINMESKR